MASFILHDEVRHQTFFSKVTVIEKSKLVFSSLFYFCLFTSLPGKVMDGLD
jgi:hypothetical protein